MEKSFGEFNHSIPIIYSHIENQYNYELSNSEKSFAILFTSFDYHFITGEIPNNPEELLVEMRTYINKHNKKEFILFAPNEKWENYLKEVFKNINGVIDLRCTFKLDEIKFKENFSNYSKKHDVHVEYSKDNNSLKPYYKSLIDKDGKNTCFSNAFMIGNGHAEIDVWTDESYRNKGLAYEASLFLINKLLNENLIPNWNSWCAKIPSQRLAYKLGYILDKKIKAFIWVEDFGKF